MTDPTFDWDKAAAEARAEFMETSEWATSADGAAGAERGWDAAMDWVKRTALLRMLSGPGEHHDGT